MNEKPVIVTGFVLESSRIMKNNFKLICTTYVQINYEHGSGGAKNGQTHRNYGKHYG